MLEHSTVRAHFYCIPALCACISIMFNHFLCAFLLFFDCVPALVTCISIASGGFLDCSGLHLGCSTHLSGLPSISSVLKERKSSGELWADSAETRHCLKERKSSGELWADSAGTQHCSCAFLLYSGTVCVHFYYVQSLSVCISIIFRLCSSTGYVHFHRFGRLSGLFWIAFGITFFEHEKK